MSVLRLRRVSRYIGDRALGIKSITVSSFKFNLVTSKFENKPIVRLIFVGPSR